MPKRLEDRFWEKVDKTSSKNSHLGTRCWEWIGARVPNGYGTIWYAGKSRYAHRIAWELKHGVELGDLHALHACDNKVCVRHLFSGTAQDNIRDRDRKGRQAHGDTHGKSKLSDLQVEEIRNLFPHLRYGEKAVFSNKYGVSLGYIEQIVKHERRLTRRS